MSMLRTEPIFQLKEKLLASFLMPNIGLIRFYQV